MNVPDSYYDKIMIGLGTSLGMMLKSEVRVSWRNDHLSVYLHGGLGLISIQELQTIEFDGWEVFDAINGSLDRFTSVTDAHSAVLKLMMDRELEIELRGDCPADTPY